MSDIEDLRHTIAPKSDQLNADDLIAGPVTVTVIGVRASAGDPQQPIAIDIGDGLQPYKPCKSMRRVLIALWGQNGKAWIGRRMTLYCDPSVIYGGVRVGGIRISHMSDIGQDTSLLLTTTRSKRKEYVVKLLTEAKQTADKQRKPPYPWKTDTLTKIGAAISSGATTADKAIEKCQSIGELTQEQIAAIKAIGTGNNQQEEDEF